MERAHVEQKWPDRLWIVRHGQSESNVARVLAERAAREDIGISVRDVDVPLSALGLEQARAVGAWLGSLPPEERPNAVLVSPYRRAVQTAAAICEAAGIQVRREDGSYVVDGSISAFWITASLPDLRVNLEFVWAGPRIR